MAVNNVGGATVTFERATGSLGTSPFTIAVWAKGYSIFTQLDYPSGDYINAGVAGFATDIEVSIGGVVSRPHNTFDPDYQCWYHNALVYDGTEYRLYATHQDFVTFDCVLATSLTATMPASAVETTTLVLDYTYPPSIKQFRVWTSALSIAEIKAEARSATAVKTSTLYSDIPLATLTDTADVSGNGNEWTLGGTLATYVPALVVPESLVIIASLPASYVEPTTGMGDEYVSWYQYTAVDDEVAVGYYAVVPYSSNFLPSLSAFSGPKSDPFLVPWGYAYDWDHERTPSMIPVRSGDTYYFCIRNNNAPISPATIDADVSVSFEKAPQADVPAGSILITDDTSSFPALFMSETDGAPLRFVNVSVADKAVALPNGYFCMQTSFGYEPRPNFVTMYDSQLNVVAAPDVDDTCNQISHDGHDTFYISSRVSTYVFALSTLTTAGVFTWDRWRIPTSNNVGFAPSWDGTVLYYYMVAPARVGSWDLVNDVALTTFSIPSTYNTDLLVLADGTLLVGSASRHGAERYATNGTLLNTYGPYAGNINRLASGNDDPDSFWIWTVENYSLSTFRHVLVSDGTVLASFSKRYWGAGRAEYDENYPGYPTDPDRFGHSNSCSILVIRQAYTPPEPPTPPVVVPPDVRLIRRLRQSPHLSDEQVWLFFSQFQLDMETGLGAVDGQGVEPQVMLQWSDNNGRTWSNEHWITAGRLGRYKLRAIWRRLGKGRQRVWRVVVSDPIAWRVLDAYVEVMKGSK